MSDFCRMKVLRIPFEPWAWGWTNIDPDADKWAYVEKHFDEKVFDTFRYSPHTFTFAPTEGEFVDYILEIDPPYSGLHHDSYGKVRELSPVEQGKYLDTFRQLGNINMYKVRLVDYCWYNATEAPDYYEIKPDSFYDPV